MDETQFISVEDQTMQDSSEADDLGKGITNLGKAIQDCKKSSDKQFAFMKEQFAAILAVLSKKTVNTGKIPPSGFSGSIPHPLVKRYEHHPLKLSEVDLPTFKGENPEAWLRNCESYFQFHFIKYEEWVNLAESHLDDRARIWYTSWKLDKRFITWTLFCNELCRWFDSQRYNDVVDEASKVEQPQESVEKFGASKVIDKMPSQASPVSSQSLSFVMENSCSTGLENNQVDDEMIADEESSGLVDDDMTSLGGASISAKETRVLFDDSTESIIDQALENVGYISPAGSFDQVLGSSGDETLKFFNKSTGTQLIKEVGVFFLAKREDLEIACKVFDEMPRPFFVKTKGEISGDVDRIPPTDVVQQIFDPGISISLYMHNKLFNKLLQPSFIEPTDSESISGQYHPFATFLGHRKSVLSFTSIGMVFIFDPGGCGVFVLASCDTYYLVKCLILRSRPFMHTWRSIVACLPKVKVAKSLNECTGNGHYLLIYGFLIECYEKMTLKDLFPTIASNWYQEVAVILWVVSASCRMGTKDESFIYDAIWSRLVFSKSLISMIGSSFVVVGIIFHVDSHKPLQERKGHVEVGLDGDHMDNPCEDCAENCNCCEDTIHVNIGSSNLDSTFYPLVQGICTWNLFSDMLRSAHKADHFGAMAFTNSSTQARETIMRQSVLSIKCYTFTIVVEHFVWDPGTTLVVVFSFTAYIIEDNDVLRGMEKILYW